LHSSRAGGRTRRPHPRGSSSWRPLLAPREGRRALTAVEAIVGDLRARLLPPPGSASAWDLASSALCLTYLAQATGETGDALSAQTLLDAAIDFAGDGEPLPMCLHRGAAGLAWIPRAHRGVRTGASWAAPAASASSCWAPRPASIPCGTGFFCSLLSAWSPRPPTHPGRSFRDLAHLPT
jgi:hypothetical protein